jgi:hypothetical protein
MPASGMRGVDATRIQPRRLDARPFLREGEHVLRHQIVLVEQDHVGVDGRQLATAVRAAEIDEAGPELLQRLTDRTGACRRRRHQPFAQIGTIADRSVDPCLREVVDLRLRRHHEEHIATAALEGVGCPERGVDQVLGREDLGCLLDHDERMPVLVDRAQRRDQLHRLPLEEAMRERPVKEAIRIAFRQLPLRRVLQRPPIGGAPRR